MNSPAANTTSNTINYIEFAANNLELIKQFYSQTFNWQFTDYGPEYTSFENAGVHGGFYLANKANKADIGGALVVLVSNDLVACKEKVLANGGKIKTDIFSFPGGQRFHFLDPCENELAVWCTE